MAKILIVGGTGLKGAHAALQLRDLGYEPENSELNYSRNTIRAAVQQLVAAYS